MSKMKKRKEQKKADRKKRLAKERNQRANQARFRYRLDIKVDGDWKSAKRFRTMQEVDAHVDETEEIRKKGDTQIIEGRVMDMNYTFGREVLRIRPFNPCPDLKDAASKIKKAIKGVGDAAKDLSSKGSMKDAMKIEIPENSLK